MPTDGADFQRRRCFHGKYYVEVKNGADALRLAQVAVDGLIREVRKDCSMPMLRPMVDAAIDCLQEGNLFASNTAGCAQELAVRLAPIIDQFSEYRATREVREWVTQVALEIRAQATRVTADECRVALLREFAHRLLQAKSLDYANGYTLLHRKLDRAGVEELEASVHEAADCDLLQLAKDIYGSPTGIPMTRFRHASEPMVLHTAEALSNEVLRPGE